MLLRPFRSPVRLSARLLFVGIAVALAVPLTASGGRHDLAIAEKATKLPAPGFYRAGPKGPTGEYQLGVSIYKVGAKTLVLVASNLPTGEYVCRPSGQPGQAGQPNKVRVQNMPLKSNGTFTGSDKQSDWVHKVTGKFPSATKVDVTFIETNAPFGQVGDDVKNEKCDLKKRFVLKLTKQKDTKGLPF